VGYVVVDRLSDVATHIFEMMAMSEVEVFTVSQQCVCSGSCVRRLRSVAGLSIVSGEDQNNGQREQLMDEVAANAMGLCGVMTQNYYFSAKQNAKRLHGVPFF
jgi:hypothetical protein